MDWSAYTTFLLLATAVILIPGPDFAVITGNTVAGGRRRGLWCALGVSTSNALQGGAVAVGLGALIVNAQPVFHAIKWAGAAYLVYLGVRLLLSAVRGHYALPDAPDDPRAALRGWRQGFLSNITNPKVLVFYLAVLPQFLNPDAGVLPILVLALTHAVLGLAHSVALIALLHRARRVLVRRQVRRSLDGVTGVAMIGFGGRLAFDR
jgi:threonine/homoserine/homoserine lactone efflux protein